LYFISLYSKTRLSNNKGIHLEYREDEMQTKYQISLTRKTLYGIMLLGIFLSVFGAGNLPFVQAQKEKTLMQNPTSTPPSELASSTCYPGTGWRWTSGPSQPDTARQTQLALSEKGVEGDVVAYGFGEMDSCGNFVISATDFSVTLKSSSQIPLSAESELSESILTVFSKFGKPHLGNIQITFGPANTKFYPGSPSAPDLTVASNPPVSTNAVLNKKVYLLVYDPILSNGQHFSAYMGWASYATLVSGIIASFQTASSGQLQYTVAYTSVVTNEWPIKIDGFHYTEAAYLADYQNRTPHQPIDVDYNAIIDDPQFGFCGKLNNGEIDELWVYGGPLDGFYESRLVGPNGYWFNSPPMNGTHGCNKLLPIMGLNFERGIPEALESFGHRTESTMTKTYGDWQENRTAHNWDRYGLVKAQSPNYSYSGCGSIHYPANGVIDYDWGNTGTVLTNCADFQNYPNLSDPLSVVQPITCTAWNCTGLGYLMYWYSHLPSNDGCATDAKMNNWWQYFSDTNLALNPNLLCPPPPCPTITNWKGEYWMNSTFLGSPALCRNDFEIHFDWGLGSPDPIIPNDNFSVSWTRTANFTNGTYRFHIQHDDGARLYIDGTLKGNFWGTCCVWDVVSVPVSAGTHTIQMEMFENSGVANAGLWWEPVTINGWRGEYYNNETLDGNPSLVRDDANLDFEWEAGAPDPFIQDDHFSVRWTRNVSFAAGIYTFEMFHDDGARLYIDDILVFENWCDNCRTTDTVKQSLSGGIHNIRYEMRENLGWAAAKFTWNKFPVVSNITRTNTNPTAATSVNFTVTFSRPVTGVDTTVPFNDFFLTTTGSISGASIISVSGSGSVYTVTVNTGSGNGTIRLGVVDDNSIIDAASMSLGGAAIGDGNFTTGETYTINRNIETYIGGVLRGGYLLGPGESTRQNYAGMDSGPVKVMSTDGVPIVSAIREAWAVNGVTTSFFQMMGLPQEQLSDTYVFPGYNNVTLNEQLRISNVDSVSSTVTVTIGGVLRGTYPLAAGEAVRVNYAGLDSGPVVVQGTTGVKIISAIREAWAVNGVTKSFVQLMGLPKQQLSDQYVFPGYNNVTLNEQLRIGNVDSVESTVTVTIGGVLRGTYTLQPNEAVRVNYAGVDSGPVIVQGTTGVKIISAIREAWAVNGVTTSFAQLMGLPSGQLSNKYVFPGYNNVTLNDQLRIGNVDSVQTTVTVTIGGVLRGTYTLQPNEAVRVNYAGVDSGPVVVEGTTGVNIISAIREAWAVNGVTTSFVQLMGLPSGQLSSTFWFPAYNNVTLNEQLRIAVP
jgi:hypothetical protein